MAGVVEECNNSRRDAYWIEPFKLAVAGILDDVAAGDGSYEI